MPSNREITSLLSLLDDEDETIAVEAMAQLLELGDELDDELAALQDSSDPLLRRRVHELQSALIMRRRRSEFSRRLAAAAPDVCALLVELHLQWFDSDSMPDIRERLDAFLAEGRSSGALSLGGVAGFMREHGFSAERETTLHPEDYCVGVALSDRIGSTALFCQLGRELARPEMSLKVVRYMEDFALYDGQSLLLPGRDWRIVRAPSAAELDVWDDRKVLKFAALMLFSAAVNSDSFRYVLTIAQAVSGLPGEEALDYLPYPYRPAPEEPEYPEAEPDR